MFPCYLLSVTVIAAGDSENSLSGDFRPSDSVTFVPVVRDSSDNDRWCAVWCRNHTVLAKDTIGCDTTAFRFCLGSCIVRLFSHQCPSSSIHHRLSCLAPTQSRGRLSVRRLPPFCFHIVFVFLRLSQQFETINIENAVRPQTNQSAGEMCLTSDKISVYLVVCRVESRRSQAFPVVRFALQNAFVARRHKRRVPLCIFLCFLCTVQTAREHPSSSECASPERAGAFPESG